MINHLAAAHLPADVPAFLRSETAINEIAYLGPEPDRWRNPAEPELVAAQAPEHFIDLELADAFGSLPHKRLDFEALAFAHNQSPERIGLQPWQTEEVWERLKVALREYRIRRAAGMDILPVEQAAIFYAGWLGHYVGDGAQPLHTTVNYNGWNLPENPHGYTTAHTIHWAFEGPFVDANIYAKDVEPRMTKTHAIEGNIFNAYVTYLRHSHSYVEQVYILEKQGGFAGTGTPESRDFAAARIAAGASMLRDLIYTAWLESDKPAPDPYAPKAAAKSSE